MGIRVRVRVRVPTPVLFFPSFLFFDFFSFGFKIEMGILSRYCFSSPLKAFTCLGFVNPFGSFLFFPELSARVRVRVLEILFPFLYFFSDPNTDLFFLAVSVRHFSCAVAVVTGVPVTSATPSPFSLCFYPVRVRVTQRQPGSATIVRIECVYLSVYNP